MSGKSMLLNQKTVNNMTQYIPKLEAEEPHILCEPRCCTELALLIQYINTEMS